MQRAAVRAEAFLAAADCGRMPRRRVRGGSGAAGAGISAQRSGEALRGGGDVLAFLRSRQIPCAADGGVLRDGLRVCRLCDGVHAADRYRTHARSGRRVLSGQRAGAVRHRGIVRSGLSALFFCLRAAFGALV